MDRLTRRRIVALLALAGLIAAAAVAATLPAAQSARAASRHNDYSTLPPIKHVWVIVEENKDGAEWELLGKQYAPYLATTLVNRGALLRDYYGTGHASADNYISMISGQPPTYDSKDDCPDFTTVMPPTVNAMGVADTTTNACVYPDSIHTIADELDDKGMTWKAYQQGIPGDCSLASSKGEYERKHNPFVFFMSLRDDGQCASDDVGLDQLTTDLKSEATTPNYSFITPDECNDGHSDCIEPSSEGLQSETDELAQTNTFLQTTVPEIMASPAYQDGGLIAIIWDESDTDLTSCCGEVTDDPDGSTAGGEDSGSTPGAQIAPGAGGGVTGAVFLSPYITPGTVTTTDYNHYSFLKTLENMWGLPLLGYANTPGLQPMSSDVFTNWNGTVINGTSTTAMNPATPAGATAAARQMAVAECQARQPYVTSEYEHHTHSEITIRGRVFETRCAVEPKLSQIRRVQVAMALRVGSECRWVYADGRFGPVGTCATPVLHPAIGGRVWHLTLKLDLVPGKYLILGRGIDAHGHYSTFRHRDLTEH